MKAFAELLDRLTYTPSRNAKLRLMQDYFRATPDPDRGWALTALTDGLPFSFPLRRTLADMMARRMDPDLFRMSRDYVGDTAETIALVWNSPPPGGEGLGVGGIPTFAVLQSPPPYPSPTRGEGTPTETGPTIGTTPLRHRLRARADRAQRSWAAAGSVARCAGCDRAVGAAEAAHGRHARRCVGAAGQDGGGRYGGLQGG